MPLSHDEEKGSSHGSEEDKLYYDLPISNHSRPSYHDDVTSSCEETALLGDKQVLTNYDGGSVCTSRSRTPSVTSQNGVGLSIWTLSRTQKITLAVTGLVDLLSYLSVSIMAPFFPEEALKKDVSDTLSGWIFGTSPFVNFVISPLIGKVMPYTGVKFLFLAGMFLFSGCTTLFGMLTYVPVDNGNEMFIVLSFLLQIIRSVGISATSTSCFVLLIREFPDNVSTAFGFGEVFVGLGLVVGPGLGGILYGLGGFVLPFVSIGLLGLLCLPVMAYVVPFPAQVQTQNTEKVIPFRKFLKPKAIIISLTIITSTYIWAILDPTLEPFLRKFDLSPEMVGAIFLVMAGVYAISSPLGGWLSDKMDDPRPMVSIGFIFAAIGCLLIGPSDLLSYLGLDTDLNQLWLIILSLVILGGAVSFTAVPTFDMLFEVAQESGFTDTTRTYGFVAGLWLSMYSLGDFIGPSAGGVMLDTMGFEMMSTYSAGLSLLMAIIVAVSWIIDLKCCKKCCCPCPCRKTDFMYMYEPVAGSTR